MNKIGKIAMFVTISIAVLILAFFLLILFKPLFEPYVEQYIENNSGNKEETTSVYVSEDIDDSGSDGHDGMYLNNEQVGGVIFSEDQKIERWVVDYIESAGYEGGNLTTRIFDEEKQGLYYFAIYDEDIVNYIERIYKEHNGDMFYEYHNNVKDVYILRFNGSVIEMPMYI